MIELRGITWDHPRGFQPLAATADLYAEQFGVKVHWDKRSLKDFGDYPINVLVEQYDLIIIDHPHVGVAYKTRCLLPLDSCITPNTLAQLARESAGPSHASYFYHGHQWGLAIDAAMQVSVYRPDLMDEAFPDTWDDVIALGERLHGKNRYIALPLVPTDAICSFLSLCASLGDPPGKDARLVGEATGLKVLEILVALAQVAHPDSLKWNPIYMLNHMTRQDDVVYCPLSFGYTNYARIGYAPKLIRFHDIPGISGALLGGTGFAVSAQCKYPAEACAYGAWLCSGDIQRTFYVEQGGQPGNRTAWTDDTANTLTNDFFRDTLATLDQSYVRPRHNRYPVFQEKAGDIIHAMLRDVSSVTGCLEQLMQLYADNLDEQIYM